MNFAISIRRMKIILGFISLIFFFTGCLPANPHVGKAKPNSYHQATYGGYIDNGPYYNR
jgi:hypothetical protein